MKQPTLITITKGLLVLSLTIVFITCQENTKPTPPPTTTPPVSTAITPAPFPTNIVPGFKFPEDTTTIINGWLGGYTSPYFDTVSIYKHAWGIWAGLTSNSGQKWNNQDLLVFETWSGIEEIQTLVREGKTDCPTTKGTPKLSRPHQFDHARGMMLGAENGGSQINNDPAFQVTVAYDPTAACFVTKNKLLDSTVVMGYQKSGGIGATPIFPRTAITTKPTYYVGKASNDLITIPAWTGPPSTNKNYPESAWTNQVYIDVKNAQPAGKKIVPAPVTNPTPEQIAAATCNLNNFDYFILDAAAAAYVNQQDAGMNIVAGDLAILICMHVATKEISNWTWQTFFWTADPDNPPFPSNAVAAAARPSQLQGAASHYAVSTAYAMVAPNQPITGGTNKGVKPVIGYNPYLEPGLGQLNSTAPKGFPNKLSPALKWGMQSNCMSCHSLAAYPGNMPYTADQYISLDDPIYKNNVQLDFAWSIQGNIFGNSAQQTTKK